MVSPSTIFKLPGVHIDHIHATDGGTLVAAHAIAPTAMCPGCRQPSRRVHSRYTRSLADMPVGGTTVRLRLEVRRFVCATSTCARTTFVEQIPEVTVPHAQQTVRLNHLLTVLGFALGGEGGTRIANQLRMPTSADTLLRRIRQAPLSPAPAPRVLGVDDWAQRKGHTYGTILCDLERRCPIDLLPDPSADTLAHWLTAQPQVEIISRDRAAAYADGATRGAPHAVQVADRWHILKNLGDAVESVLQRHRAALATLPAAPVLHETDRRDEHTEQVTTPRNRSGRHPVAKTEAVRLERRATRLARYTAVAALRDQGLNQTTIAARTGVSVRTVQRFLGGGTFPERKRRRSSPSPLDPFLPYLHERWEAGCSNATQLWRDLCEQGYTGSYSPVYHYVRRLRAGERPMTTARIPSHPDTESPSTKRATPRTVRWLLLQPPHRLDAQEHHDLTQILDRCAEVASLYPLAQAFAHLVRDRMGAALEPWLVTARASAIPELRRLARGIDRDKAAVEAALRLPWSNGQVEGQVNRLKLLKRAMYGRAKLDLLRQRVLYRR